MDGKSGSLCLAALSPRQLLSTVERWGVSANGVPAEWVEATVASLGQRTLVIFSGGANGSDSFGTARHHAGDLAMETGARVLVVGCRRAAVQRTDVVKDSVDAYAWLLSEGLDLDTTALAGPKAGGTFVAILLAAKERGLSLPDTVIWLPSWEELTPSTSDPGAAGLRGSIALAGLQGTQASVVGHRDGTVLWPFGSSDPSNDSVSSPSWSGSSRGTRMRRLSAE